MSSKKEHKETLSQADETQVQHLLAQYQSLSAQLQNGSTKAEVETILADLLAQPEPVQIALLKQLAKTTTTEAANVVTALNAFSTYKEARKEARRALMRLETAKIQPQWIPPITHAPAVQLQVENPPRFWKGFVTQSREEGEVQIFLCWEQGYDYSEARAISLLLDYWNDGVKDAFVEAGSKRRIEERLTLLRSRMNQSSSHIGLVSCTLAEGKRLLEEALSVNKWRGTQPASDYLNQLPLVKKLILQAADVGEDHGTTFITPEMEEQEVVVNFIGAWSFGDFGLAYDLLTSDSPLRDNLSRDEWVELHRSWYDEANPTHMDLGFVRELEAAPVSGLWLPASAGRPTPKKEIDVGWSLELLDTPLSGTLKETPMGTSIHKDTGRHWFWNRFTLIKTQNGWRIQQMKDEGAAIQGLSITELQKRIKTYEEEIDALVKQPPEKREDFVEAVSWRLNQILHYDDALIAQLPLEYATTEQAYSHAVLTGNPQRMIVYLERLVQKFAQGRGENLRRLGATFSELAYRYDIGVGDARAKHFLTLAETTLRESLEVEDIAVGHMLLGELLMSLGRNEEAEKELLIARDGIKTADVKQEMEASIEAGLGNIAMRMERYQEAIPHFRRVATSDPRYPGVLFSLGFAYRLLGEMEDAAQFYQQALDIEPSDIRIYSELTAIYMQRSEQQQARALLERGVHLNPGSVHLHAIYASVLHEMGDRRAAQKQLEEAEKLDPQADIIQDVRIQMSQKRT